jgi:Ca2+-binding RTX toxin-like protein
MRYKPSYNAVTAIGFAAMIMGTAACLLAWAAIINGTLGDDVLSDTLGNDVIRGFSGDDDITSAAGNDRVDGGEGDDQITITSDGRTYIRGGEGNDIINALSGNNHRLYGDDGADNIVVGASLQSSRIDGGDGDDVIDLTASTGNNVVYAGDGDDEIEALDSVGNSKIYAGPGQDNVTLGIGSSFIEGGEDADVIVAGTNAVSRDIISIRVGDVPTGETEKITCTTSTGATTIVILRRNGLGSFPRGTPTNFDTSGILTIDDPLTGGTYEIRKGDGNCLVVRR